MFTLYIGIIYLTDIKLYFVFKPCDVLFLLSENLCVVIRDVKIVLQIYSVIESNCK